MSDAPAAARALGGRGAAVRRWLAVQPGRRPSRMLQVIAAGAAVTTYLLIAWGGVVRVTGSGLGCGASNDWPLCRGQLLPPLEQTAVIEFAHRWLAAIATALVIALVAITWARYRHIRRLVAAASAILALFGVQIALGAAAVELKLPGGVVLVHLANALLLLAMLVFTAVVVMRAVRPAHSAGEDRPGARRAVRWVLVAAGATYVLALSGSLVVADGASAACGAWPLCGSGFELDAGHLASINLIHRALAGAVTVLVAVAIVAVRRRGLRTGPVRLVTVVVMGLLVLQIFAGALVVELHLPPAARGVHLALASAFWASTVLLAVLVHPALRGEPSLQRTARSQRGSPQAVAG